MRRIGTAFGAASVVVGGLWAVYEYRSSEEGERTKYTLQMIEDWETKGYRVAYGELREAYASFLASLSETDRSTAASIIQGRANLLANFARRMGEDPKKRDQIREVVYFFNRLGLCEGSGVCSHETTAVFFDDTVRTFVEVFQPYIDTHFASLPGSRTTVSDLSRRLDADR
ncbi:DUF4760 domain-containing protein [Aureimonas leprariae]|uniref:DUF4760 domain-containing protein n=1 Tax=Plantimonas leprariae TaxID=2615207 RepID=UPI001AEE7136|nr:hypothetical protein [Aureimonas leprariae]